MAKTDQYSSDNQRAKGDNPTPHPGNSKQIAGDQLSKPTDHKVSAPSRGRRWKIYGG